MSRMIFWCSFCGSAIKVMNSRLIRLFIAKYMGWLSDSFSFVFSNLPSKATILQCPIMIISIILIILVSNIGNYKNVECGIGGDRELNRICVAMQSD